MPPRKHFPERKNEEDGGLFISHRGSDKGSEKSFGSNSEDSDLVGDLRWPNLRCSSLESADGHGHGVGVGVRADSCTAHSVGSLNMNTNHSGCSTPSMPYAHVRKSTCMSNLTLNDLSDKSRASSIISKNHRHKLNGNNRVDSLRDWVTIINKFANDEVGRHMNRILYHIISYHIISYHIISYHIASFQFISYHVISYLITSYRITSYHIIMPCHAGLLLV